ncbi:MAG: peptidylprolyl isomerase [Terriglobales bacterium]
MKVGDTSITQAQFDALYADFRKANQGGPVQKLHTIADNFAGALMLSQQAVAQGMDKDPEIVRQLEMNRIQILSNAAYERLEDQAKPRKQEIEAYYNSHLSDFDEVQIRRLFVYKQTPNSNGHGVPPQEAKARADEIRKVLASGGDAKALIANTKDALDAEAIPFKRGELPGNMAQAFDMKVGEWSEVADTPEALLLFEVVKKDRLTLAQGTPVIERKLQAQKLREEMEALKKTTGVWMDEEYFSGPVSPMKGAVPNPSEGKRTQDKD